MSQTDVPRLREGKVGGQVRGGQEEMIGLRNQKAVETNGERNE